MKPFKRNQSTIMGHSITHARISYYIVIKIVLKDFASKYTYSGIYYRINSMIVTMVTVIFG